MEKSGMNNKVICFGEVLWDDFGDTKKIGGAPLNVCYHLSKLDIDAVIVSQVGDDELGRGIIGQLDKWHLDGKYCQLSPSYETSTVLVNVLENGEVQYTIREQVAWDFIPYNTQLAEEIKSASAFVYGTLAARSPFTRDTLLRYLELAPWKVLDLNLRPPYVNKEVLLKLIRSCHSLKLNRDELEFVITLLGNNTRAEKQSIDAVFAAFENIREIILTKGAEGASYFSRHEQLSIEALSVEVADTVGSGDSFLAAFIGGRLNGLDNEQVFSNAAVLSAFIATRQGACPSYTLQTLEEFKQKYYAV